MSCTAPSGDPVHRDHLTESAPGTVPPDRLWKRGFWSLFATQFQGAFSDNAFKTLALFLILGMGLPEQQRNWLVELGNAFFAIPFILFSMAGGYLADRYSKRSVTIGTKLAELLVMGLGIGALGLASPWLLLAVIFLMATHSAFFGPSKWGLLPELLPEKRLSWGNGILELGTYTAFIVGGVSGGVMADTLRRQPAWGGVILVGLASVGLLTSLGISRLPAADPHRKLRLNFFAELASQVRVIRRDRVLTLAIWGNIYFNFLGTLLLLNTLLYGKDILRVTDTQNSYLQAAIALGIGIGSFAAGRLSGGKIEYGLIPLGSVGISALGLAMARPGLSFYAVGTNLFFLGFFGGFFIVPIMALIQHRPDKAGKGGVIGASNLLSFAGVMVAPGIYHLLHDSSGFGPSEVFLLSALGTLAATAYVCWLLPDSLLRFLLWMLTHTLYRIRLEGRDNIPERGGALLVSNHLSLIDAVLLIACTDRPIRFLIDQEWYDKTWLRPFARVLHLIPVSPEQRPRELLHALRQAGDAVRSGELVCIFAEGQITRTGNLLPFRRGYERIMKDVDAPIIPVHLDNVWGSIFSFERGKFVWKWPRRVPYPVTVSIGAPMPSTVSPPEVRQAVQELHAEAYRHHRDWLLPLHRSFLRTARRHPFRFAMADARVPQLRFGAALLRTLFLARRLKPLWKDQDKVGILLPPSVGGALVNYAARLLGKVPVNLNYTASAETLASCASQCGLQTVVTSQAFLERVKIEVPGRVLLLEELAAKPRAGEKLLAFLFTLCPAGLLERVLGRRQPSSLDELATIIFSSGSTGHPKGVPLTEFNIAANIEQMLQVVHLEERDRLLGILPFFHSFGFTVGLWLPAVAGIGVVYHPNPVEAKFIGSLVRQYRATLLVATPTFLQAYVRRCAPEDFGSLQFVLAGAEKLAERVARAFEDRFGIRVLEGYGCTECAPVVAVNVADFRDAGFRQVGGKRGKIGHPLPGVAVRIVDPESGQPVPLGQRGMLLVRGPNIMQGYLGLPEKTAEVLRDGWYATGDIAFLDEDGFLEITDRLSRFSKIGGEMVPHMKVEEMLQELAGSDEPVFAVTGVPDERKGERLVVLHTLPEERLQQCVAKLSAANLPNLWKPDARQFFRIECLPYLGTGKLDLRTVRELAQRLSCEA